MTTVESVDLDRADRTTRSFASFRTRPEQLGQCSVDQPATPSGGPIVRAGRDARLPLVSPTPTTTREYLARIKAVSSSISGSPGQMNATRRQALVRLAEFPGFAGRRGRRRAACRPVA